jgi:YfiH family protein
MTKEGKNNFLYDVDTLVTNMKNICIGVSTADCVPVLLFDEKTETIAAIHAGWRGVVNNIVAATIEKMSATFSVSAEHLKVVIGPSISQKSFEVGDKVYDAFEKANFDMSSIAVRASQLGLPLSVEGKDKWHIDLWAAITMQLLEKGVELNNITISNICTFEEHEEYFSARRNGISSGRLFTGIMMTE